LFSSEKKENKVNKIIKAREKIFCERLKEIKKNLIEKRFDTFNDKNNINYKKRLRPLNKIEKNQILNLEKINLHKKRLYSAETAKRTEREKFRTQSSSSGLFKNVTRLSLINQKKSIQKHGSLVSLFINGISKSNNNEKKYINNQDITQDLKEEKISNAYYKLLDKVITKKKNLSEEKNKKDTEINHIDPLILDKIIEKDFPKIFKRNNSETKLHNQLTIEKYGDRKRIKLKIPPPIPIGKKII